MKSSLIVRLALLVGALGLLQAAGILAFAYFTMGTELAAQQRRLLQDKVEHARQLVDNLKDSVAVKDNAYRIVELVNGQAQLHMAVASVKTGEPYVAFSREAMESLRRLKQDTWGTDAYLEWRFAKGDRLMLSVSSAGRTMDGSPYEVVLSVDRAEDVKLLHSLLLTAATAVPFALALVSLAAMGVVALGLRPLRRFEQAVSAVTANNLQVRLDTGALPQELLGLAQAFNAMLDRLRESVLRLSQFSADLAHEMRTPLSTLLGRTQVSLSQPRGVAELVDVLAHNTDELQRLSRLVADMLFLAQAEQPHHALQLKEVDLSQEALRVAEFLEFPAQERSLSIIVAGSASAVVDGGLMQRALANLLSNAIRHASPGTQVLVSVSSSGQWAQVSVENSGEEIPVLHWERLFDRFYRIDSARGRDGGGTGLGLAIVKAIMSLHGGRALTDCPGPGRVRFALFFPTATSTR